MNVTILRLYAPEKKSPAIFSANDKKNAPIAIPVVYTINYFLERLKTIIFQNYIVPYFIDPITKSRRKQRGLKEENYTFYNISTSSFIKKKIITISQYYERNHVPLSVRTVTARGNILNFVGSIISGNLFSYLWLRTN